MAVDTRALLKDNPEFYTRDEKKRKANDLAAEKTQATVALAMKPGQTQQKRAAALKAYNDKRTLEKREAEAKQRAEIRAKATRRLEGN